MKQDIMKPTPKVNTFAKSKCELLAKSVAAIDLIGMAIPGGLLVKSGAKLAIKGAIKASKCLKEPAKAIAREAKKKATEAVDKAWGFAKGLFGGGKKSKTISSKTGYLKLDLQMFASNKGTGKVKWNNGYRSPDGKFAKPTGSGRSGADAEEAAWKAIESKKGWEVTRGRVHVRDSTGQLRVYDGVAKSPSGRTIGLEVKLGSATKTPQQRAFDNRLNSSRNNKAFGVGNNKGITVDRSITIRK
ncbi:hypothetical protein [Paenibacillus prosopidis]|nr:hypothetical protein [Paenibacillus prosopidis]